MFSIIQSTDTSYGILSSGLTEKTKFTFISSNSSFSECARNQHFFHHQNTIPDGCSSSEISSCISISRTILQGGETHSFLSCYFLSVSSSFPSGGALYLHSDSSADSTSLRVEHCLFDTCTVSNSVYPQGGGALYTDCGTLSVLCSVFISCASACYGGGLFAYDKCRSSDVTLSTFINCSAGNGGGLQTFTGPTSSVNSCRFLSCVANRVGGGLYHDGEESYWIKITDSLFTDNYANYKICSDTSETRGGGGFEDGRSNAYSFSCLFSFFTRNRAPYGVGNDISVLKNQHNNSPLTFCFTTTSRDSFWNNGSYVNTWLHKTIVDTNSFDYFSDSY